MRDKEETFISAPKSVFQPDVAEDDRIDSLSRKLDSLEAKVNSMSRILIDILRKLEPSRNILEAKTQKRYGFTPEDEVD